MFTLEDGVNTQPIETFYNELKVEIKKRKGIITERSEFFLKRFCFFNNLSNFFNAVIHLLETMKTDFINNIIIVFVFFLF